MKAALDQFESSLIEIWHSDDFSDDLSAVPEDVDRIEIEGETYHRFVDHWRTDGDGPIHVEFRGTWMSEDDALDAENEGSRGAAPGGELARDSRRIEGVGEAEVPCGGAGEAAPEETRVL